MAMKRVGKMSDEDRAMMDQFVQNSAFLDSIWEQAMREHPGQWVIVYDDQKVLFCTDVQALLEKVPRESLGSAELRLVVSEPTLLAL